MFKKGLVQGKGVNFSFDQARKEISFRSTTKEKPPGGGILFYGLEKPGTTSRVEGKKDSDRVPPEGADA